MTDRPSYKTTLFDRLGPDAADQVRAIGYGVMGGALMFPVFLALAFGTLQLGAVPGILFVLAGCVTVGGGGALISLKMAATSGQVWNEVMVSGSSTPYIQQHSYQQALVMQGRVDEALSTLEATIIEPESTVDVRLRTAELYTREAKNHVRAAELFREAIHHPKCTVGEEVYAANRLVDLLNGPLEQPGRALVELRCLADRYPKSIIGENARQALRSLKSIGKARDPFEPPPPGVAT